MTTTTTTTTRTPAQERIDTRNRRYKYAKESADKVNNLFAIFSKIVDKELTASQVHDLVSLASDFNLANETANRRYDLYSDFCDTHDYKVRDITFVYPYEN